MTRALLLAAGALALTAYTLPDEQPATLPDGPERDLVVGNCTSCHSWDYVATQPRGMGAGFWQGEVAKMIEKYGAPIEAKDAAAISAYLARTQG